MKNRKVKFSLSIGLSNAQQSNIFTFEQLGITENDYKTEEELQEILEDEWKHWSNEYIDGGIEIIE